MSPETEAKLLEVLERLEQALVELGRGEQPTLSIPEARERLGCSRRQVFKLLAEGKLSGTKAGKERRVTTSSIDDLLGLAARRR